MRGLWGGAVVLVLACASAAVFFVYQQEPVPVAQSAAQAPLGSRAACKAYDGLPDGWPEKPHAGMVLIEGGTFKMGSMRGYAGERPLVRTQVASFWIDRTEVTNAQFATFVTATGYVTTAERRGGAVVFIRPENPAELSGAGDWWHWVEGANWRHPTGPGSSVEGHANEPVVNVSLADAKAYADWLGRSLPTEAQWEYAAKAGRSNAEADMAIHAEHGEPGANYWQGFFPFRNAGADGFSRSAPVGCFSANPFGLYDMIGNVWEWTRTVWHRGHSHDMMHNMASRPGEAQAYVIKGGSFLCSSNYCARARASSRQPAEADLPAVHVGFRTVAPVK